jgi:hypothetical protein
MGEAHEAEASGALTPGMELIKVSRNTQKRMPCKTTAAAGQGSSLVYWAPKVKELIADRGRFNF